MNDSAEIGSRALFPTLIQPVFANHASVSPLATPSRMAIADTLNRQSSHGVAAMAGFHEDLEQTRMLAGQLLNVDGNNIALMANTSLAISSIAASIPWTEGDKIVLFRGEFPANTTPWLHAAKRHNLDIAWLDASAFQTDKGLAQLSDILKSGRVRLVAVSAVQFSTGLRMPVEAMAKISHRHGAEIFVDAIQAVGSSPFDTTDLDYIASGGQKWLMGPPGAAMLYVRDWSALEPTLAGWLSHTDPLNFLWGDPDQLDYHRSIQAGPALFEGGTANFAGFAGLAAAMRINLSLGSENIHAHANQWIDNIEPALVELGFTTLRDPDKSRRSCILSVRPPNGVHAGALGKSLAERGISVSTPDAKLRFSPSWPNSLDETDFVMAQIENVLSQ